MKEHRIIICLDSRKANNHIVPYRPPFAEELEMNPEWVLCVSGNHEGIEEEDW